MKKHSYAIFVGGRLDNIRGVWSEHGGVLDNAAFDVAGFISDVEAVYDEIIWNGMRVVPIDNISPKDIDGVIIMAAEYGDYIKSVRNKLALAYDMDEQDMVASMFIQRIPWIGNWGGLTLDEQVPRGKFVNVKAIIREGWISGSNDLETFFLEGKHLLIDKWTHYFEVYNREFARFRGKKIRMLEIGVFEGGSLQMWADYFGKDVEIVGVDINPSCKRFETGNIKVEIGSQEDFGFLNHLKEKYKNFDIILDDGGHSMRQQIVSFRGLFPILKNDGIYMCEDCHTSYMKNYGGGYGKEGTFWEMAKKYTDGLNDQFIGDSYTPNSETLDIKSIRFYNSIVVFEKQSMGNSLRIAW